MEGFELGRWEHAQLPVQAKVVEPTDVLQSGVLDIIEAAPGAAVADQFGLVEAVEGFGQSIVVA